MPKNKRNSPHLGDDFDSFGGPAFPSQDADFWYSGMKMRDYLAAQALMGMIASSPVVDRTDPRKVRHDKWAEQAYRFADAMLEARK